MGATKGSSASLDEIGQLTLSVGRMLLEFGGSARTVHAGIHDVATGLGCDRVESYCQHAAIIVMLRRGSESCAQMGKVGEHGVNLRASEAVAKIVSEVARGESDFDQAQRKFNAVASATPRYPVWIVCLATGLACAAFGRLLHAEWLSFVPVFLGASVGQWIRHSLARRKHNIYFVAGAVSFVSAFIAGWGSRVLGSPHLQVATIAAVLLLVPGVAVLNAQLDVIDGRPNLAAARLLRVLYLLLFMTFGLVLAQRLVIVPT